MATFLERLARYTVKAIGNSAFGGMIPVGDLVIDVFWESLKKAETDAQIRADLAQLVRNQKRLLRQLEPLIDKVAGDQPEEVKEAAAAYLQMVPLAVRHALRRPDDPSGMTVPPTLRFRRSADLRRFLPDEIPAPGTRFPADPVTGFRPADYGSFIPSDGVWAGVKRLVAAMFGKNQ